MIIEGVWIEKSASWLVPCLDTWRDQGFGRFFIENKPGI